MGKAASKGKKPEEAPKTEGESTAQKPEEGAAAAAAAPSEPAKEEQAKEEQAKEEPAKDESKPEQAEAGGGEKASEEQPKEEASATEEASGKEEAKEGDSSAKEAEETAPAAEPEQAAKVEEAQPEEAKEEQAAVEAEPKPEEAEQKEEPDAGELVREPGAPDVPDEEASKKTATIRWDKGGDDVKVSGNWNDWELTTMEKGEDGAFSLDVSVAPGKYHYRFNVDGEMKHDEDKPLGEGDAGQTINILTVE